WDFGGLYIKNCKVFNHILENLAIFSQGRNQFFPIVMRAGRDFKGRLIIFGKNCKEIKLK
ncbi:MAG: hypothetical protein SOZ02_00470, partial [Hallerella porci]|uniref:hypothetical protein n=1 Tax=Hallerella porci TaxID=1945871 RepID=UPI002A826277